ncbi:PadR family transcriptional regulator [Sulfitobacter sp. S190]|nr:PadR family transcriptional regulator [Sulfitobacter sp. S190]
MTGYEIAKRFEHSLSRVWPARPNQIYTELNRMADAGLIAEIGREARNARRYEICEAGQTALRHWMQQDLPEGGGLRFEPLLKANFLWTLPQDARAAWLAQQRQFWEDQIAWLDAQAKHLPPDHTDTSGAVTSRRQAAATGRRIYGAMKDWATAMMS